jgi:hypothetical protein
VSFGTFITDATTSRTLSGDDAGANITFTNSSNITVTLPNSLGVGFTVNLLQQNMGQVQCAAAAGATVTNLNNYSATAGTYAMITLEVYANSDGSSAVYGVSGQAGPTNSSLTVSVQQVAITIAAGATSNTATITAVTAANAFVLWQGQKGSGSVSLVNSKFQTDITLTNSTTVTATRGVSDASNSVTIYGTVIEFVASAIQSIQQGTIAIGSAATTNTATISAVVTNNTFVHYNGCTLNAAASEAMTTTRGRLNLTNTTTITATRNTSSTDTLTIRYVAVEFKAGILNSAIQTTATTAASTTMTVGAITTVNSRYSMFIYGGYSTNSGTSTISNAPAIKIVDDITVGATTPTGTATTSGFILEFTSAQVKPTSRFRDVVVANTTSATRTIPAVNTAKTAINLLGWFADSALDNEAQGWEGITLTNSTTVTTARTTLSATVALINSYEVIEFL